MVIDCPTVSMEFDVRILYGCHYIYYGHSNCIQLICYHYITEQYTNSSGDWFMVNRPWKFVNWIQVDFK